VADRLSTSARVYVAAVTAAGLGAALAALARPTADLTDLAVLIGLAAGAAIGQVCIIEIHANHGFPTGVAFVVAGALLLPRELLPLLALAQYAPELVLRRTPAVIQAFNASNCVLNALTAWLTAWAVLEALGDGVAALLAAGVVAGTAFVLLNHVLLGIVLRLARGHTLRASGLFSIESLSIDLGLALVGVGAALLAEWSLLLLPVALAPLLLVHRLLRLLAAAKARMPVETSPAVTR
jgi:hypothetical protein